MKIRGLFICILVIVACIMMTATFCPAEENKPGASCVEPAKGPLSTSATPDKTQVHTPVAHMPMIARVGKPAPDFEANAYFNGGFKNIRLSSYKGKWVVLCFYPGDFTFV